MDKDRVLKDLKLLEKTYNLQTLNMTYNEVPTDVISYYKGVSLGLSMAHNLFLKEGFSEKDREEIVEMINFIVDKLNEHEEKVHLGVKYKKEEE